jgi:hypothetical protein
MLKVSQPPQSSCLDHFNYIWFIAKFTIIHFTYTMVLFLTIFFSTDHKSTVHQTNFSLLATCPDEQVTDATANVTCSYLCGGGAESHINVSSQCRKIDQVESQSNNGGEITLCVQAKFSSNVLRNTTTDSIVYTFCLLPAQYFYESYSQSVTMYLQHFTEPENYYLHSLPLNPPLSLAITVKIVKTYLISILISSFNLRKSSKRPLPLQFTE